jgi:hypothetical protein
MSMYSLLVTREHTTKDMLDWLKVSSPKVKIVALIPSAAGQLRCPDFNVVLNDLDEWMNLLAATAS